MRRGIIIVIFGASGSGKTTLVEQMASAGNQYSIHKKSTDRPPRKYDDYEIEYDRNFKADKFEYVYQTYGHRYGISLDQINEALGLGHFHFIICNDISTIKALKRDFGTQAKVVFHYFDAPIEHIHEIQRTRQIPDDEVQLRLAKTAVLYRQFVDDKDFFDATLINNQGEEPVALKERMEHLLIQLQENEASSGLIGRLSSVAAELEKKARPIESDIFQPNYAFIIMPIRDGDHENEDVHQTIKRACKERGISAERVDEIQYTGQITEKIQGSIELAEFVIVDLTYERPNVYYELGYADAHGKPLILVAKHESKVHFDIQGMNIRFYKGMHHLQTLIDKAIDGIRLRAEQGMSPKSDRAGG